MDLALLDKYKIYLITDIPREKSFYQGLAVFKMCIFIDEVTKSDVVEVMLSTNENIEFQEEHCELSRRAYQTP